LEIINHILLEHLFPCLQYDGSIYRIACSDEELLIAQ